MTLLLKKQQQRKEKEEESTLANNRFTQTKKERNTMNFIGVLEKIGKEFAKGLEWAIGYAVPAEKLVGLLFPAAAPAVAAVVSATTLIQNAVLLVEQKYAAANNAKGTGTQKLAEVIQLAGAAVSSLLGSAGIKADTDYIQKLVSAVVSILNVQGAREPSSANAA